MRELPQQAARLFLVVGSDLQQRSFLCPEGQVGPQGSCGDLLTVLWGIAFEWADCSLAWGAAAGIDVCGCLQPGSSHDSCELSGSTQA